MDISIFASDKELLVLRERAKRFREHATTQFFLRYLSRHIFFESKWIHGCEVPPADHHNQTRMDNAIQELAPHLGPTTLIFRLTVQAKHGKATDREIGAAESQSYALSWAYLHHWKGAIHAVWAMTCYGSSARLWACLMSDKQSMGMLVPFYPLEDSAGEKNSYRDIQEYENDFEWAFNYIKITPEPDPTVFDHVHETRREGFDARHTSPAMAPRSQSYQAEPQAYGGYSASIAAGPSSGYTQSTLARANYSVITQPELSVRSLQSVGGGIPTEPVDISGYAYMRVIKVKGEGDDKRTKCLMNGGEDVQISFNRWEKASLLLGDGRKEEGFIAHMSSGNRYYTWSLQPSEQDRSSDKKGKGKEKATKGRK